MTTSSFNFGEKSTNIKTAKENKPSLELMVPEKRADVNAVTVAMINLIIDSFDRIPEGTSEQGSRNIISKNIARELPQTLTNLSINLTAHDKRIIHDQLMDEIFGFGPLTQLLNNDSITEIMVNACDEIYVEHGGKIQKIGLQFRDDGHVHHIIDKILTPLGRRVDESSPYVDARLPDGSRVNIIIPPLALKGPTITIRKFAADPFTLEDLIAMGTLTRDMFTFLQASIKGKINVIISGGTGSGKTTLLNVLSSFIPENERIITLEDAAELQLQQPHVVKLESRPKNIEGKGEITIQDLLTNSLRMNPDRIIVGEVRRGEALDMLQAMNTGHDGSMSTTHANTPRDCLARLETMVYMSGVELPSVAIREQIASAIQLIVQVTKFPDGSRKIDKISEIIGIESGTITTQDIFTFTSEGFAKTGKLNGYHRPTGIIPVYIDKIKEQGQFIPTSIFAVKDKRTHQ